MTGLASGGTKPELSAHRGLAPVAILAVAVLVLLPILANRFIPSNDYPFHLARMVILANLDDPIFSRFYQMGSFLLPNLAMDAIAVPLSQLLGPELATRAFVGLTLIGMLCGAMLLHWAAHRRLSLWPLLAAALLYNGIFRFGFFNYLFGLAAALFAAALWVAMKPGAARLAVALVSSLAVMYCHMEAFGILAVTAAAVELERAYTEWPQKSWSVLRDLCISALPFVLAIVLFLALSPTASEVDSNTAYAAGLGTKPVGALFAMSSGLFWIDAITILCIAGLLAFLATTGSLTFSRPLALATALLVVALFALPSTFLSATYVDVRLGPAIALLAAVTPGIRNGTPRWIVHTVAAAVVALVAVQSAVMTATWAGYNRQIAAIVDAMRIIEPGSTIFAATADQYPELIADTPERRSVWAPSLKHIASYAVLGAPVFVPMTWAEPAQQPLNVKDAYQEPYKFQHNNPRRVYASTDLPQFTSEISNNIAAGTWPELGGVYILLIDTKRARTEPLPAYVERAAEGERFVLLRLKKPE